MLTPRRAFPRDPDTLLPAASGVQPSHVGWQETSEPAALSEGRPGPGRRWQLASGPAQESCALGAGPVCSSGAARPLPRAGPVSTQGVVSRPWLSVGVNLPAAPPPPARPPRGRKAHASCEGRPTWGVNAAPPVFLRALSAQARGAVTQRPFLPCARRAARSPRAERKGESLGAGRAHSDRRGEGRERSPDRSRDLCGKGGRRKKYSKHSGSCLQGTSGPTPEPPEPPRWESSPWFQPRGTWDAGGSCRSRGL